MSVNEKMTAIADAIRGKTGKTEKLTLDQMPGEIAGLGQGGGDYTVELIVKMLEKKLTEFTVPDGCTSISDTLMGNHNLTFLHIPNSVTNIGSLAGCIKLEITELPDTVEYLGQECFASGIGDNLTRLPANLKYIGRTCFGYCYGLKFTEIPEKVETLDIRAFVSTNLTEITFKGTPISIASNAFEACTNLTSINVPWSEGAVANAPWGATNATINYNYVEG